MNLFCQQILALEGRLVQFVLEVLFFMGVLEFLVIQFYQVDPHVHLVQGISLLASPICYVVNPEMLSTKRFYDGNAIYRSHGLRNCRMLSCIYVACFSIALISILIRSNDKIKNIFICSPPRVFIHVSRPICFQP